MTGTATHQAGTNTGRPTRGRLGRILGAAVIGLTVACSAPAVVSAAGAPDAHLEYRAEAPRQVAFLGGSSPSLKPHSFSGQLASRVSAESTGPSGRSIAAGVILVLFAGLGGLTFSMWRDLGRRVDSL